MDISKNRIDGRPSAANLAKIPSTSTGFTRFLRIRQVMAVTGLSRMTIYRLELTGNFPSRRRLAENSVAWLENDVAQWIDSRPIARLRGTPHTATPPRPSGDAPRRTP